VFGTQIVSGTVTHELIGTVTTMFVGRVITAVGVMVDGTFDLSTITIDL